MPINTTRLSADDTNRWLDRLCGKRSDAEDLLNSIQHAEATLVAPADRDHLNNLLVNFRNYVGNGGGGSIIHLVVCMENMNWNVGKDVMRELWTSELAQEKCEYIIETIEFLQDPDEYYTYDTRAGIRIKEGKIASVTLVAGKPNDNATIMESSW